MPDKAGTTAMTWSWPLTPNNCSAARACWQAAAQDPWLQALQAYLQANRYQTATAAKLWAAFNEATGEDVAQWMQPWTYRSGYPLVNVTLGGASGRDVMVSQVGPGSPPAGACGALRTLACLGRPRTSVAQPCSCCARLVEVISSLRECREGWGAGMQPTGIRGAALSPLLADCDVPAQQLA